MKLRGCNCLQRKVGSTFPDAHPDAWESVRIPNEARAAVFYDRTIIGGREFFLFREYGGDRVWAMNAILWSAAEGGPSNKDPEQERLHKDSE